LSKPRILIARTVFPEVVARLQQHFDVTDNQADVAWTKAEWTERLSQHVGAFSMGIDPVDESVLQACPQLKICANMSVGYNNLDVPAMTRHGVLATNAPDVLTETTADFGFALMMAAARRVSESEHFFARWPVEAMALRLVRRCRGAWQHLGHHGHGPHWSSHRPPRRIGFWHASHLSQPQPLGP